MDVHKGEGPAHVDACGQGEGGQKRDFFVDVINGWPLVILCTGTVEDGSKLRGQRRQSSWPGSGSNSVHARNV